MVERLIEVLGVLVCLIAAPGLAAGADADLLAGHPGAAVLAAASVFSAAPFHLSLSDVLYVLVGVAFGKALGVLLDRLRPARSEAAAVRGAAEVADLEQRAQLLSNVFHAAREGILITDPDGTIVTVNNAASVITGYGEAEIVGGNPKMFSSGRQGRDFYRGMWTALEADGHWEGEIWNRRKDGAFYAEFLRIRAVYDRGGRILNYIAFFTDITQQKLHRAELEKAAYFDALTGLPNRLLLSDRLNQALARLPRDQGMLAVALVDIDGFKEVNDLYGHALGDELLITMARRMRGILRAGDTLARLGGDEFVAVITDVKSPEGCQPILERLLEVVSDETVLKFGKLKVTASLGVSIADSGCQLDPDQLLRQADQAMYQAKIRGKNQISYFDTEVHRKTRDHHEKLTRVRVGLAGGEFVLFYQPKIDVKTGTVFGAEALARWQHPELGLVPPNEFLPLILDHDLVEEFGEWVISTALRQMQAWAAEGWSGRVSVNIDLRHLQRPNFPERVEAILGRFPDVPASNLEFEVLEHSGLDNVLNAVRNMEMCQARGISFALDDFGSGYSSLMYLRQLPVSCLKIDGEFVQGMLSNPSDLAIVGSAIDLSEAFACSVIAEGVETPGHQKALVAMGCDLLQGYAVAKPMPAGQFLSWTRDWVPSPDVAQPRPAEGDFRKLLFVRAEIIAWSDALLADGRSTSVAPGSLRNRFGSWVYAAPERFQNDPCFREIVSAYGRFQTLAAQLSGSADAEVGDATKAELRSLRDTVVNRIDGLLALSADDTPC